jgi:heparosan-N-sulfate-glucuronate 5-epimerase
MTARKKRKGQRRQRKITDMSSQLQALPFIRLMRAEWQLWQQERTQPRYNLAPLAAKDAELRPYALDMEYLLTLPFGTLDENGVLYNRAVGKTLPAVYHPTSIAQYALAQWNTYLHEHAEQHKDAFLVQARWLLEHEVIVDNGAGAWPMPFSVREYNTPPMWLSALTQGNAISVLIRAHQITGDEAFRHAAQRAVLTFQQEINAGGVAVSFGEHELFFEEVASYPAAHVLNGYILALFGLYDYVIYTGDKHVERLIERSLSTLHTLIDNFDLGYWSCYDLHFFTPSPLFYHALHVTLFEALARFSGCEHCAELAVRWDNYQKSRSSLLRYFIASRLLRYRRGLQHIAARMLHKETRQTIFSTK